jgi:hypothetical protein
MANGNGYLSGLDKVVNLIPNLIAKSVDNTASVYIRKYIPTWGDIQASGTRGGAIEGRGFGYIEDDGSISYNMYFDDYGNVYRKVRDKDGKENVTRVDKAKAFDKSFESRGGLDLITGGVYGGEPGDRKLYHDHMEDWDYIKAGALDVPYDHYRSKAVPEVIGGNTFYRAELPVTDNVLDFLDYREYDPELLLKYYNLGTWYDILDPFFGIPKHVFMKQGIPADPILNTQFETAKSMAEATGPELGVSLLLSMWLLRDPIKQIRSLIRETVEIGTNEFAESLNGFIRGYNG